MSARPSRDLRTAVETSFAHFAGDFYPGFLPALLPYFRKVLQISRFRVGLFGAMSTVAMFVQPVLGELGDRISPKRGIALGVLLSAVFYSLLGLTQTIWVIFVMIALAALGVTLFHPCAASLTGSREFRGMALFTAGGSVGFGGGALVAGWLAETGRLRGLPLTAGLGVVAAVYLAFFSGLSKGASKKGGEGARGLARELRAAGWGFFALWVLSVARAIASLSFNTFLPILVTERGGGYLAAAMVPAVNAVAGAPASYLGGWLADRLGWRKVMAGSFLLGAGALYLALRVPGHWKLIPVAVGGAAIMSSISLNIVLGQRLMPKSAGFSSSLMMGFAWGAAALFVPFVGKAADLFEAAGAATPTETALTFVLVVPVLAGLGSLLLRTERKPEQ